MDSPQICMETCIELKKSYMDFIKIKDYRNTVLRKSTELLIIKILKYTQPPGQFFI